MDGTTLAEYVGGAAIVRIPEGVAHIAPGAFRDRKQQIEEVVLPESLREIMPHTFASCRRLKKVVLPANLRSIGAGAFQDCEALTEIEIPAGVRSLRRNTFAGCRSLARVRLTDGLQTLEDGTFKNCSALTGIRLPETLRTVGSTASGVLMEGGVFAGSGLRELRIPAHVEVIGSAAFRDCGALRSASLPDGLRQIGSSAFSGCAGLRQLRIPASVTAIGAAAFRGCRHPEEIALPRKMEKMRMNAGLGYAGVYNGCRVENGVMKGCDPHLREVRVPAGVTTISAGAFNRLTDDLSRNPRQVAVRLPEALETFERSRLGEHVLLEFCFPPKYLQQTHQLPMPFTRDLIAAGLMPVSVQDAASLYLFQGAELSEYAAQMLSRNPDQAARAMFAILRCRRSPHALLRTAVFAEKHAAVLRSEVLPAFCRLAIAAGDGAAAVRFALAAGGAAGAERFCREYHEPAQVDEVIRVAGLDPDSPLFGRVQLKSGAEASAHLIKCLLAPYLARDFRPRTRDPEMSRQTIDPESRQLERVLDMPSLQLVLDELFPPQELYANPRWFSAYCRFANAVQISEYDRRIRELYADDDLVRRHASTALVLSDTREAMCRAAEYGCSGRFRTLLEYWSHIRGRQSAPFVDGAMRVHLDADGVRRYDFSGRPLQVRLDADLALGVWDADRNEPLTCPASWELGPKETAVLKADLEEMEAHLHVFQTAEKETLRRWYISGHGLRVPVWERLYLRDPVRRLLARNLIWTQGHGRSFRVTEAGLRSFDGSEVRLAPTRAVRLAHVLEMTGRERRGWETRPAPAEIDQMGERVRCGNVPADHYNGLSITVGDKEHFEQFFGHQSDDWQRMAVDPSHHTFVISCRLAPEAGPDPGADAELRLGSFFLTQSGRAANLALNLLDDMTIRSRIRQDDPAALSLMESAGCSAAELRSYLDLALEVKARHLTAALLERQRPHVPGADDLFLA